MNDFLSELITAEHEAQYNAFIDKFKPKKTTDDCYTPENIYNAVADYVSCKYNLARACFVRPFYPGGDYEKDAANYDKKTVVVDNPPFSILKSIIRFYMDRGIKFFLFAPYLTVLCLVDIPGVCALSCGVDIIYENGAIVKTAFVTNMADGYKILSEPELYKIVYAENKKNLAKNKKELPKYEYPAEVITATKVGGFAKAGVDFRVKESEAFFIRELQAQKNVNKHLFGAGFLISAQAAQAAQAAKRHYWHLSKKEKMIVDELTKARAADDV